MLLTCTFSKPLTQDKFDYWVKEIFEDHNLNFDLWGKPIKFGKEKIHAYGFVCETRQIMDIEFTTKNCFVESTDRCTLIGLANNIKRFIDSKAKFFIDSKPLILRD